VSSKTSRGKIAIKAEPSIHPSLLLSTLKEKVLSSALVYVPRIKELFTRYVLTYSIVTGISTEGESLPYLGLA
jgi:hypothetical protein